MVGCSVLHFRDSPYCHDHSSRDLESVKQQVGGTSELEDEINRAVEKQLAAGTIRSLDPDSLRKVTPGYCRELAIKMTAKGMPKVRYEEDGIVETVDLRRADHATAVAAVASA